MDGGRANVGGDVVVIGGGPAGSAFAILAAKAGRRVTLLEQTTGATDKVCGEFLSGEALTALRDLGIDAAAHGAQAIGRVRLAAGGRAAEVPLPFPAMSMTRRCMDELLLAAASRAGVQVVRGAAVEGLAPRDGAGWTARTAAGMEFQADSAVLATGKHNLRGFSRPPGRQNDLVGLKMYWRLSAEQTSRLCGAVHLFLFREGYAGLQVVEDGTANLSALVRGTHLKKAGGYAGWLASAKQECLAMREYLDGALATLEKPLAIASLPYGMVRQTAPHPALWAIGDQAAVIPSFTGDGMSIALESGVAAARSYLAGGTPGEFQQAFASRVRRQVSVGTWISRAMLQGPLQGAIVGGARLSSAAVRWVAAATRIRI